MKRILLLATVAAIMTLMLVAMASAALAIPPASSELGCEGGQNNANHATGLSSPSYDATFGEPSNAEDPSQNDEAPGTQNNRGLEDHATENTGDDDHCRNEPPEHPHD